MIGKTSLIRAVNIALKAASLDTVETLSAGDVDVDSALSHIEEASMELQSTGWYWNTVDMKLSPDTNGNIILGDDVISIEANEVGPAYIQVGPRIYDPVNRTYKFTEPLELRLIIERPWDLLPEMARKAIAYRGARVFQQRVLGDQLTDQWLTQSEQEARIALNSDEIRVQQYNHIDSGIDSRYATTRRNPIRYGWGSSL